jgi:hypothetical protein
MGYIIDFKNGSRCVFFSEKRAVSNFFFRRGGGSPKKVGNLWLRGTILAVVEIAIYGYASHFQRNGSEI